MLSRIVSKQSEYGRRYFAYFVAAWVVLITSFVLVERWADRNTTLYHEVQFNEQQVAQVQLARQGIDDRIQGIVRDLGAIPMVARDMGLDLNSDLAPMVARLLKERPEIIGVMVLDADQKNVQPFATDPGNIEHVQALAEPFSRQLMLIQPNSGLEVSDYHFHNKQAYVAIASSIAPVPGSNEQAWLAVFIDMGFLFDAYVAPLRVGEFGAGYVLDHTGNILYDHEPEVIGRNVFDGLHDKYPDLLALDRRMIQQTDGKDEYEVTVKRGGAVSRKLVAWNSLGFGDSRLIIAMSAPDSEIHASIETSRQIVFAAIALLAVGFSVTTYVFVQMRQRLLNMRTEDLAKRVEEKTEDLNRELQARVESEDRFRDFAESTSDWLWEMDRELRFTFISERYKDITGFEGDFAIGKTRQEMVAGGVDTDVLRKHFHTLEQRRAFRDFRYELNPPIGEPIAVNISGKPVFDEEGNFRGYRGVGSNITEQVHAQEIRDEALREAERANLAKSEFLAAMSHELRTPLNAILGFSEVIHMQLLGSSSSDKYTEYARDIHSSAAHLLDLVNDLLDVSAIEAGKTDVHFSSVQIAPLIQESAQAIIVSAANRGIDIETEIEEKLPEVEADSRAIRQILLNLLSNAIKFSDDHGGKITVSAKPIDGGIQVQVADTGIGISSERLSEITRPFVRGQRDPYKAERGWGLGLSIVSALVSLHGGNLHIDSKLGEGTTVTFNLCVSIPATNPDTKTVVSEVIGS